MAFVHRARRSTDRDVSGGTSSSIGPGSYAAPLVVPVSQTLRLSYAPFASSAERAMLVQDTDHGPGPGEHSSGVHPGKPQGPSISSAFVSSVARFRDDPRTAGPGPGHFQGPDLSWAKRQPKGRRRDGVPDASRKGGVEWVRSATAPPSIPAPAQSFGYEENDAGELVLQRPSHLSGHTGRANDIAGPGEYLSSTHEHPFAMERKRGFVEWSKSRTHRDMNIKATGVGQPGPGSHFNADNDSASTARGGGRGTRTGKKVSAFFASTAPRLRTNENLGGARKDPVPGVGTYSTQSDFDRIASTFVPEAYQFFGSKTGRMEGPDSHYAKHGTSATPGPGHYPSKSSIRSGAPDQRGATDPYVTPASFASSSSRFEPDRFADQPGPGAFLDQTNTSLELSKKIFGRNTSFGTTEQRFTLSHANGARVTAGSKNETLGPGSHETNRSSLRTGGRKPQSVFVSATKRFDAASGRRAEDERRAVAASATEGAESFMRAPLRGIGSEPSYGNGARNNPSAAFAAAQPRFDERARLKLLASSPAVGPGLYETNGGANLYRRAPAVSSSFKATQRDQGPHNVYAQLGGATGTPGPGTYTKDVSRTPSNLIKRSFNITIATEV